MNAVTIDFNQPVETLKQQLESILQAKDELSKALKLRMKAEIKGFSRSLKKTILDAGYDIQDVLKYISMPSICPEGSYTVFANPLNNEQTYRRGVLPQWMKDMMIQNGLDPLSKSDREKFKKECLVKQPI